MSTREHSEGTFEHNRGRREIDELLLRITRLVHARELPRKNGGDAAEVQAKTGEIARLQWRLAHVVRSHRSDRDAAPDRRSAMTRARPAPPPRGLARVTRWLSVRHPLRVEAALVLGLYALYETTRGGVAASRRIAIRHAHDIVAIERSLHLFVESDVQREAEHISGLIGTLGVAYLTVHLVLTSLVLLWLHRRRPDAYPLIRTTLLLASTLAVIGYALFPTAPPRLSGLGISDTITSHGHVNLNKGLVSALYNPYAAVPSMHAAYALIAGFALFRHGRHLLTRLAGGAYPALVLFVIVATGNHFFFDAAAGALVAAVASAGAFLLPRPAEIQPLPLTVPAAEPALNRRAA